LLRRLRFHVGDDAVWGFGAKWLPTFLGTPPPNKRVLALAVMVHVIAIALALAGLFRITTALIAIRLCWRSFRSGCLHARRGQQKPKAFTAAFQFLSGSRTCG
jgi:hypothetical protein